ncbi:MAG: hypothetical protein QOJ12_2045 [Thermoleophilales bacterium]|jgi:hypothetical protein|nr:hypothetical protein [Thermoleophilales bacterium]
MDKLTNLSATQIVLGVAGLVALVAYVVFIFAPSWKSYGRIWERLAAGFLSLYIAAALVGIGIAVGVGVVALYVQIASN